MLLYDTFVWSKRTDARDHFSEEHCQILLLNKQFKNGTTDALSDSDLSTVWTRIHWHEIVEIKTPFPNVAHTFL